MLPVQNMSQPVKLSDALVIDARVASELMERSIAGQIEFWSRLGRAIEPLLQGTQVMALSRNANVKSLSDCLDSVDTPEGRERVSTFLQSHPFPHYEPSPESPGLLIRTDANGKKTTGRFVNRKFEQVRASKR
jgi:hypothetical protein